MISAWYGPGDSVHRPRSRFASLTGLPSSAVISSGDIIDELTCSMYRLNTI